MRELTVRIRFSKHSLGNVKSKQRTDLFLFPKNADGKILFLASWHKANMRFAAKVMNLHHDEVDKIYWDIVVDGQPDKNRGPFRRYYTKGTRERFVLHEAFWPEQVVGINCVVPEKITDDDFWELLRIAGQYKGVSPWKPGEWGNFEVVSIRPRRIAAEEKTIVETPVG